MSINTKAPGRWNGRGADQESTKPKSPDRLTPRRARQGLIRVTGGIIIATAGRFITYRATADGCVQAGAVAHSFGAALAALGGRP